MRERLDLPPILSERHARLAGYVCLVRVMASLGECFKSGAAEATSNPYVSRYRKVCIDLAAGKASDIESTLDGPSPDHDLIVASQRVGLVRSNKLLDGHARRALQDLSGIRRLNISPIVALRLSQLTDYYTAATISTIRRNEKVNSNDHMSSEPEVVGSVQGEAAFYILSD